MIIELIKLTGIIRLIRVLRFISYNLSYTTQNTISLKPLITILHYNLDNRNTRNNSNKLTRCVASTHGQERSTRKPSE
jgi:hypothetical protein